MAASSSAASPVWRIIPPLNAAGTVQMAVDEWLLEQHRRGVSPPCLRFYTWSPAAISLGYHQRDWPSRWQSLIWNRAPIDLVRRPTGGRAVLHQGDLTYAAIASGFSGNRMQVYQHLCQFLIAGLRSLDLPLEFGTAGRGYIHNPNCFGTATAADLVMANGAKLIGSAQLKRGTAILQHGSIRLHPDADLHQTVFGEPMDDLSLPPHLSCLTVDELHQTVMRSLLDAAEDWFGMRGDVQPLTAEEWQAISRRCPGAAGLASGPGMA